MIYVFLAILLLSSCTPRVSLQFAADELDRVAIIHNEQFRPTYLECQATLNELSDAAETNQTSEGILDISVLVAKGKLERCSEDLSGDWEKVSKKIADFKTAANHLK